MVKEKKRKIIYSHANRKCFSSPPPSLFFTFITSAMLPNDFRIRRRKRKKFCQPPPPPSSSTYIKQPRNILKTTFLDKIQGAIEILWNFNRANVYHEVENKETNEQTNKKKGGRGEGNKVHGRSNPFA